MYLSSAQYLSFKSHTLTMSIFFVPEMERSFPIKGLEYCIVRNDGVVIHHELQRVSMTDAVVQPKCHEQVVLTLKTLSSWWSLISSMFFDHQPIQAKYARCSIPRIYWKVFLHSLPQTMEGQQKRTGKTFSFTPLRINLHFK